MRFKEFIEREIKLAQASKPLDALTARFVQLHQQAEHDKSDAAEYRALHRAMRTRWRWQTATLDAQARRA
jgi:hypothetical protein